MKSVITLLLILTLNTYVIFTHVAKADETGMHDTESAETVNSAEVSGGGDETESVRM